MFLVHSTDNLISEYNLNDFMNIFLTFFLSKLDRNDVKSSRIIFLKFCYSHFRETKLVEKVVADFIISLKGQIKNSCRLQYIKAILIGEHIEDTQSIDNQENFTKYIKNMIYEYEGLDILKTTILSVYNHAPHIGDSLSFLPKHSSGNCMIGRPIVYEIGK